MVSAFLASTYNRDSRSAQRQWTLFENMPRPSLLTTLTTLSNMATLATLSNLAKLATLSNLTILVSLTTSPVVGLKIEASTESFTDGFAEVPNGDLLLDEG